MALSQLADWQEDKKENVPAACGAPAKEDKPAVCGAPAK